jgi:transcriptional regulator with XRE-family HTH domain
MPTSTQSAAPSRDGTTVGHLLREWRTSRGVSQLDLAMRAGFSARHVSFIETGRAQPSRQAVLVLAEALDVPLRDRNRLLEAGGYAHVYRHTPLDAEDMRHIRGMLQFILDRHEPFGAVVLDRYSNLIMANTASQQLFQQIVDPGLMAGTRNIMRLVFDPSGLRRWIVNWPEVADHLLSRCERELGGPSADDASRAVLAEIRQLAGPLPETRSHQPLRPGDVLLPVHIRRGDIDVRLFSTIMTLGTPQDVTLQELRIETFFPADGESEAQIRAMRAASP